MPDDLYGAGVEVDGKDRYTVTLTGELDLGCQGPLRALVDAIVETGAKHITFDMTGVEFCGSPCLGVLIHAAGALDHHQAVSVRPSAIVLRVLELTGLDRLVQILP